MTTSAMTTSDLFLSNLDEHQVIRIEGRAVWVTQLLEQVQQCRQAYLEYTGALDLQGLQLALADYLDVEPGASFIQQALKSRLAMGQQLLIAVNCDAVDVQALTYLLGLPSICDEQGTAVTILLVSTPGLLSVLKYTPSLAAKLDGYYQENKESTGSITFYSNKKVWVGLVMIAGIGLAAWYAADRYTADRYTADKHTADKELASEISAPLLPDVSSQKTVVSTKTPQPQQLEKAGLADKTKNLEGSEAAASIETVNKLVKSAEVQHPLPESAAQRSDISTAKIPQKQLVNSSLANELAATVESAKKQREGDQKSSDISVEQSIEHAADSLKKVVRTDSSQVTVQPKGDDTVIDQEIDGRKVLTVVSTTAGQTPKNSSSKATKPSNQIDKTLAPVAVINNEAEVQKVFERWGSAWESQNWEAYVSNYVQNTTLYGVKMSIEEWRAFRKARLLSPEWIKLEFGKPKYTRLNSHWYRVEFYQRFEKPGYADETTKRLELTLTTKGWKIASEATDGTVVLKRSGR